MNAAAPVRLAPTRTVMVLDDDPVILSVAIRILTSRGYHVLSALSANEALEVAGGWPERIDVLLCDLVLPGLSGREFANAFLARRPGTPVVYTSGYSSPGSFRWTVEHESHFLSKPFEVPELIEAIERAIGGDVL